MVCVDADEIGRGNMTMCLTMIEKYIQLGKKPGRCVYIFPMSSFGNEALIFKT